MTRPRAIPDQHRAERDAKMARLVLTEGMTVHAVAARFGMSDIVVKRAVQAARAAALAENLPTEIHEAVRYAVELAGASDNPETEGD